MRLLICLVLAVLHLSQSWSETYPLPAVPGMIDVKRDWGAVGDGVTNDTQALKKAIQEQGKYTLVYLPNGTYLIDEPIAYANRRVWVHGESRDGVVIKLKDHCAKFSDPEQPQPVLSTWNAWKRGLTSAVIFRQELYNVTIDVRQCNPGAIGLNYFTSNAGCVRNVRIRSSDPNGLGFAGFVLGMAWPGLGLIDGLIVEGFDYGCHTRINQYSMTFKDITLINQRKAGWNNRKQSIFVHRLISQQSAAVPAVLNEAGRFVLIEGKLSGSGPTAIVSDQSECYVRDVTTQGYERSITAGRVDVETHNVEEWCSREACQLFDGPKRSLHLAIEETPEIPWGDPKTWVYAGKYGKDSAAIQAAIDSGAHTVYFAPKDLYEIDATIVLRGNLRRLIGFGGRLDCDQLPTDSPTFQLAEGDAPAVEVSVGV